jgi:hypothetical protein
MLQKIPVKKEYLLIGGTILLLWLGYQLALKKTMEAWQLNKQLKSQLAQSADLTVQPAYTERKNYNLDIIINRYKTDTVQFRSNIINIIASIAEKQGVKLSEVPLQDPLFHTDKYIVQKLSFEGGYFDLIKTLDQLQKTTGIGIVRSVGIKTIITRSATGNIRKVMMEIYLEMVVR